MPMRKLRTYNELSFIPDKKNPALINVWQNSHLVAQIVLMVPGVIPYLYMAYFAPTQETLFSSDLLYAQQVLQQSWMIYQANYHNL